MGAVMRMAGCAVAASAMVGLAATPAWAKTGALLSGPAQVVAGDRYQLTASGGDDSGNEVRVCVDQLVVRRGHRVWVPIKCAATVQAMGAVTVVRVAGRAGASVTFRASVYSLHDHHLMSGGPALVVRSIG